MNFGKAALEHAIQMNLTWLDLFCFFRIYTLVQCSIYKFSDSKNRCPKQVELINEFNSFRSRLHVWTESIWIGLKGVSLLSGGQCLYYNVVTHSSQQWPGEWALTAVRLWVPWGSLLVISINKVHYSDEMNGSVSCVERSAGVSLTYCKCCHLDCTLLMSEVIDPRCQMTRWLPINQRLDHRTRFRTHKPKWY